LLNQPIWDVKSGIGTLKFVLNAHPDGPSIQRVSVFQFLTTVINGMPQEPVQPVIKVMIWLMDNALNLLFNNQPIWDVKLGIGTNKCALNAQPDGLSTQRVSVFQFLTTVINGMPQEPVQPVIKVMIWLMDNALNLLFNNQPIWDVKLGIGTDKYALNAHPDGPSTQRVSVFQFLTTVINGMLQEPVQPVIKVMIWSTVNVFNLLFNNQPIWDVKLGIGTNKCVSNAQPDGPSTQREPVFQFLITVINGMLQELAQFATRVTIWLMDNAPNLPYNNQLIWDVKLGIGTNKFVSNAQQDGPSTQRVSVFQFLTTVINGMLQEPVQPVIKVMIWSMDNVFNLLFNNQLIWDVKLGIGTNKCALNAQPDGLSTQRVSVFQFLTTVTNGMPQEPVQPVIKVMIWLKVNVFNQPFNNQPIWDVRPGIGTDKYVSNAQQDGLSTQREPVFQFLTTVINGMLQELVLPVIKDIVLFTDNAPNLLFNNQLIWDVKLGIGTDKCVSNAQPDGPSTQREPVFQFLTTVTNGMLQGPVLLVIKDTALLTDNVFNLLFNNQLIWDAKLGIGTDKCVSNAQQDGLSIQREPVFQFLTTVTNGMLQGPVLLVIKDTALLTDNVFNQLFNNQPIWDVKLGIGTDKFVLNAQPDGLSTQRVSVFQFLITVINGMLQEPVQPVIKVMIWSTVNVFNLLFNNQPIWDVKLGIGTDKCVSNAQQDGPSIQREPVSQFLTTVINGMLQELVPLVILDINFQTVNANLQTHFARVSIHQEPVLHASTDTFCIKTIVLQFQNWLTSFSTTQHAAQKNSNNLNKKEDFENR
jgi:hypothetical protein